jgi:hypothetical protein
MTPKPQVQLTAAGWRATATMRRLAGWLATGKAAAQQVWLPL